jgi:hypothetical protein
MEIRLAPVRWDVVVFRTRDTYTRTIGEFQRDPPISERIDLGDDLFVERLDHAVSDRINQACSAGGIRTISAQRYSFVRTFPLGIDPQRFDEDRRLLTVLALSRLIRPTSIGFEESAQVIGPMDDAPRLVVVPGPISGPASAAYIADRSRADWLSADDGEALSRLLAAYYADLPQGRVQRGLWHHENAARALDMAARWTSVVTGLEALFSVGSRWATQQFKQRCVRVAEELGIGLTLQQAGTAYSLRSRLAHGSMTSVAPDTLELYVSIERILRETIRLSLEEVVWRQRFATDDAVREAWPIETPTTCPTCQQPVPLDAEA